jgi:hypothetical protein
MVRRALSSCAPNIIYTLLMAYNTCMYLRTFLLLLKRTFHCACDSKKVIETIMLSAFLKCETPPNSHEVGENIREGRIVPIILTNC